MSEKEISIINEVKQKNFFEIECNNYNCFKNTSKRLKCQNCKKGILWLKCWNCGKRYRIKELFIRIDCSCGASIIPCAYNNYKFIKKRKKEKSIIKKICENCKKKYYSKKGFSSFQKYCCLRCKNQAYYKRIKIKEKPKKIREKQRINHHKRRILIKKNGGHYTLNQIRKLKKSSFGICKGYNRKPHFAGEDNLTIDHIKLVSKGGENNIENIQLLCKICNSTKGKKYNGR